MKLNFTGIFWGILFSIGASSVGALATVESRTGEPVVSSVMRPGFSQDVIEDRPPHFMLKQVEALKQEVSELRGLVETQQHDIEKLRKSQQDFYLELDKRLNQLQKTSTVSSSKTKTVPATLEPRSESEAKSPMVVASSARIEGGSIKANAEKEAYEVAYTFVRKKQYPEAIHAFQEYLDRYATGERAPNAYYWLGEIYMVQWEEDRTNQDLLDKANQAFLSVTSQFPGHQKVADSLLKLGLIQSEKGEGEKARQYFTEVKDRYPGTAAARIAETRLQQLN